MVVTSALCARRTQRVRLLEHRSGHDSFRVDELILSAPIAPRQSHCGRRGVAPACASCFLSCLLSVVPLGSLVARSTSRVESTARFPERDDPSSTSWMSPSVPAFLLSLSGRDRRNALHTGSRLVVATPRAVHRQSTGPLTSHDARLLRATQPLIEVAAPVAAWAAARGTCGYGSAGTSSSRRPAGSLAEDSSP